jgi:hypothetical protein
MQRYRSLNQIEVDGGGSSSPLSTVVVQWYKGWNRMICSLTPWNNWHGRNRNRFPA